LDRGLAFNAHEVFEVAWKKAPDGERSLWQGLAQLAVAITHVQRGNIDGAVTVLCRAAARLADDERGAPYGIDAAGLLEYAGDLVADLTVGDKVTPKRFVPVCLWRGPGSGTGSWTSFIICRRCLAIVRAGK